MLSGQTIIKTSSGDKSLLTLYDLKQANEPTLISLYSLDVTSGKIVEVQSNDYQIVRSEVPENTEWMILSFQSLTKENYSVYVSKPIYVLTDITTEVHDEETDLNQRKVDRIVHQNDLTYDHMLTYMDFSRLDSSNPKFLGAEPVPNYSSKFSYQVKSTVASNFFVCVEVGEHDYFTEQDEWTSQAISLDMQN